MHSQQLLDKLIKGDENMKNVMRLSRITMQYRNERTKNLGICGADCQFIMFICNNEGCTQDQIANNLCVDKSNVARRMADMESNGLIYRKPMQNDKRNLQVYPTEKSYDLLPYIKIIFQEWNDFITEDLSKEEIKIFNNVIEKIQKKIDN